MVLMEEVPAKKAVADENTEISDLFPDHEAGEVRRLSFWTRKSPTTILKKSSPISASASPTSCPSSALCRTVIS